MSGRVLGLACALAFTAAAAWHLAAALRARPLVAFAASLERAEAVAAPDADLQARLRAGIERRGGCGRSLARSRVTASLFLLGHADAHDERQRMLELAEAQARAALACNPMDGNLWFVAGWLGFQLAPDAGLFHGHLLSAMHHAPYRGAALEGRWRVLAPRLAALGFADDPRVRADLERLYRLSAPRTAAPVSPAPCWGLSRPSARPPSSAPGRVPVRS